MKKIQSVFYPAIRLINLIGIFWFLSAASSATDYTSNDNTVPIQISSVDGFSTKSDIYVYGIDQDHILSSQSLTLKFPDGLIHSDVPVEFILSNEASDLERDITSLVEFDETTETYNIAEKTLFEIFDEIAVLTAAKLTIRISDQIAYNFLIGAQNTRKSYCMNLGWYGFEHQLEQVFGAPETCNVSLNEIGFYGSRVTIEVDWSTIQAVIKYTPPENGVYEIHVDDINSETTALLKKAYENFAKTDWEIDLSQDMFPGPHSSHFVSKRPGTNAQIWIERDENHDIRWLRFSYAL